MNNKEKILRDLEYISGGLSAYKAVCGNREQYATQQELFDEWQDIIYSIIDMVEEDYEDATNA